jgi:hypothetical protein
MQNATHFHSPTLISNEPVAVLPAASVAEQDTVSVPRAKLEPDTVLQVTATLTSTMSLAVAV